MRKIGEWPLIFPCCNNSLPVIRTARWCWVEKTIETQGKKRREAFRDRETNAFVFVEQGFLNALHF
jgi:hypothetical protein